MSMNTTSLGLNNWTENEKPLRTEFNRDNEIIDRELCTLKEKKADKGTESLSWQTPTYENGYSDMGGEVPLQYAKDCMGNVFLQGVCVSPATPVLNATIFTLPAAYRPQKSFRSPAVYGLTGGSYQQFPCAIIIRANGTVALNTQPPTNADRLTIDTVFKS